MNVLMVGVDQGRIGGMWTVAETFLQDEDFNKRVNLHYVATSTCGSRGRRLLKMLTGYACIFFKLLFGEINIVHVHMAEKGSVYRKGAVVYLAKLFGAKTVIQMHAGPIMDWYAKQSTGRKALVKRIFSASDKMLVLGEFWKNQMKEIIPENKIEILYNGVKCPERNPYNADGNIIFFMGVMKREKGIFDLIDAIGKIHSLLPDVVKVYLCGRDDDGDVAEYIQKQVFRDRFVLTGWIDKEEKEKIFANAQLSVLPSYSEALSMTVIESMSRGIPVITTKISTMPELLGDDVELVSPGDVEALADLILKLNQQRSMRMALSQIEFERVKGRCSVRSVIETVLNIYSQL